jgi:ATP-dependent Clp protease ATP-binding subunit ClpA
MFERYNEQARRSIFFARYEASTFGSSYIESEHLVLGLMREDRPLLQRCSGANLDAIRGEIEEMAPPKNTPVSTSVDLPLSLPLKRALAYGAEEAERLNQRHIGSGHLLLGLLREESSIVPDLLRKHGITLEGVRREMAGPPGILQEGAGRVIETRRLFHGHEIVLVERLTLSEDGKTISYTQEISGPGRSAQHTIDFDVR